MSNLANHSSLPLATTAFASSISFSRAAMSDWSTSTFLLRKVGELKMSDASSDGSRDAFFSEEELILSTSSSDEDSLALPSGDDASARKMVEYGRCKGGGDEFDNEDAMKEVIVDVVWRGGGVRNASRDTIDNRRNSFRIMVMVCFVIDDEGAYCSKYGSGSGSGTSDGWKWVARRRRPAVGCGGDRRWRATVLPRVLEKISIDPNFLPATNFSPPFYHYSPIVSPHSSRHLRPSGIYQWYSYLFSGMVMVAIVIVVVAGGNGIIR